MPKNSVHRDPTEQDFKIALFLHGMADRMENKSPQSMDSSYDFGWEGADCFISECGEFTLGDWLDQFVMENPS